MPGFRYFEQPTLDPQRESVLPHKIISGGLPGASEIRIGGDSGIKISGKDRQISISLDEAGIQLGLLESGSFGMKVTDENGDTLFQLDGNTWYWYDLVNDKNVMQVGRLPDLSYGFAVAKQGSNVEDIFTE